ncbi:MAG: glycogen synthase, partial [Marinirhabdus sp.]
GLLDWDNCINPLAAAVKCAWRVTTVSPNYMEELKQRANGLEALVRHETAKCSGILNGIDPKVWDPAADAFIPSNFSTKNVVSGKKANKKWLCGHFSLNEKKPLVAFIGRLVGEKGADLFPRLFERVLETGEVSLLLLGSGMKDVEEKLEGLKPKFKGSYNAHIGYDEALSHKMYAGADFLLMPSRVEPCGLNQMYALHYGTVPIVSQVGGLRDTVVDILDKNGFGITHREVTVPAIAGAIKRAARFYGQKEMFKKNRSKIMKIDLSWGVSAKEYLNLYQSILKQP